MTPLHVSTPVSLVRISLNRDHIKSRHCTGCVKSQEIHQPESSFPDRMLWTCPECGTWFLMDITPDRSEAILVRLPDHGHFLAAMETGEASGDPK